MVLTIISCSIAAIAAWSMTVPLHRFKELRPKSPRDIAAEVGSPGSPPQIVRATYRRAICPRCHHRYGWADVIPVLSWIRGCPGCGRRMPWTVPAVQVGIPLATALTTMTIGGLDNGIALMIPFVWLTIVFGAISIVDVRIWLIPYWLPWVASAIGLVLVTVVSLYLGQPGAIVRAAVSGVATFAVFFVLWIVAPGKLGFSDVRLALVIGLFLGWLSPVLPIYGILFGSVIAVVIGAVSIASGRGDRFAFGPALSAGALAAVWLAAPILGW